MFNLVTSRSQRAFPPSKKSISFSHRMERVLQTTPGQKERRTPIKKPVNLHRLRGRGEGVWSCLEKIYLTPEGFIINFLDPRPLLLPIGSQSAVEFL